MRLILKTNAAILFAFLLLFFSLLFYMVSLLFKGTIGNIISKWNDVILLDHDVHFLFGILLDGLSANKALLS